MSKEVKYNRECKYCGLPGLAYFPDKTPKMRFPNGDGHDYESECKPTQAQLKAGSDPEEVYAQVRAKHEGTIVSSTPTPRPTTPAEGQTQLQGEIKKSSAKSEDSLARIADAVEIIAKIMTENSMKNANEMLKENKEESEGIQET